MNVELLCTTDDPADDLNWHQQIAEDKAFSVRVLPTFRPDRVIDIEKPDFFEYIAQLEEVCQTKIKKLPDLMNVLRTRIDFFAQMGCRMADHGMEHLVFENADLSAAGKALEKRLAGSYAAISDLEVNQYKTALLLFCAKTYHELGWTMQLHFGCRRDINRSAYHLLGANTGFDCISGGTFVRPLVNFLNELEQGNCLPKMIVYSLNPNDNPLIDTVLSAFQKGPVSGKLQHGSAWWFNDHLEGIREHLLSLSSQSYLPAFVGMLTDSRSFLSYPRHEYFRRILCDLLGQMVEEGLFPNDMELLGLIVRDICYHNAARLFE
jgi:glucuronate isomerase